MQPLAGQGVTNVFFHAKIWIEPPFHDPSHTVHRRFTMSPLPWLQPGGALTKEETFAQQQQGFSWPWVLGALWLSTTNLPEEKIADCNRLSSFTDAGGKVNDERSMSVSAAIQNPEAVAKNDAQTPRQPQTPRTQPSISQRLQIAAAISLQVTAAIQNPEVVAENDAVTARQPQMPRTPPGMQVPGVQSPNKQPRRKIGFFASFRRQRSASAPAVLRAHAKEVRGQTAMMTYKSLCALDLRLANEGRALAEHLELEAATTRKRARHQDTVRV